MHKKVLAAKTIAIENQDLILNYSGKDLSEYDNGMLQKLIEDKFYIELNFSNTNIKNNFITGALLLASTGQWNHLTHLDLHGNKLDNDGVEVLLGTVQLPNITRLNLSNNAELTSISADILGAFAGNLNQETCCEIILSSPAFSTAVDIVKSWGKAAEGRMKITKEE